MNLTETTELRKLSPTHSGKLATLLHDNWKILMSNVPETLRKDTFDCKIGDENLPKYTSEHIRLIEQGSITTRRLPMDILLEEWGSSGRIRPTLGHLLWLLQECRIYGAADYVAKILNKESPQRPNYGPEARIELTDSERRVLEETDQLSDEVRDVFEVMTYPSSNIENSNFNYINENLPQIIVDDPLDTFLNQNSSNNNMHNNSNLMQFSSPPMPAISDLLFSQSIHDDSVQSLTPHFSALLNGSIHSTSNENSNLPNVSMLNYDTTSTIQSTSRIQSSSQIENSNFPDFGALQSQNSFHSQNVSIPRNEGSPLPSLSLNTLLKHYTYAELEIATNSFNEIPYINSPLQEPNPSCGRFLGSGAFGSVYLGFGIVKRPIAVKRINLKDLNIVGADDFITKQFTVEIETLYKYKHKNLLSLLGYSCDGLTYCLLYEYVPGGNLKDRLQNKINVLKWDDRIDIATGTANAIAYLHTAYSMPLIHRDIKSANILLDAANQPKLCDFGIIRMSSNTTTGTKQILGTSAYMPPEAHRGDVSVKMDTYSFGVVLLELLTSLPPVDPERDGNDLITFIQENLEDENDIRPLLDLNAGTWIVNDVNYATEIYKITMNCLLDKKSIRPTMVNVMDELEALLHKRKL